MTNREERVRAARSALTNVLDLKRHDRVLIVTDTVTRGVAEVFAATAEAEGCDTDTYLIPEQGRPHAAPPAGMIDRLAGRTVVINAFSAANAEVPFRIAWIHAIEATQRIRLGHAPGITEAMLDDGPLAVDYAAMRTRADRLIDNLRDAVSVRITAPGGTDLVLGLRGRTFQSDLHATVETGVNLPCGEVYCAPVETEGEGVLVADGPIGAIGKPAAPVTLDLSGGHVTRVTCADAALRAEIEALCATDASASVVGELGIGLNPGARLVGCMLEDEKALRTAHIAFGSNEDMPGGCNHSSVHIDYLFHTPSMDVAYEDGSHRQLMRDGQFVV
ncbi:MAG: aminopeptidase [bacterium]|nr:aminopeptidase [bacterium]